MLTVFPHVPVSSIAGENKIKGQSFLLSFLVSAGDETIYQITPDKSLMAFHCSYAKKTNKKTKRLLLSLKSPFNSVSCCEAVQSVSAVTANANRELTDYRQETHGCRTTNPAHIKWIVTVHFDILHIEMGRVTLCDVKLDDFETDFVECIIHRIVWSESSGGLEPGDD